MNLYRGCCHGCIYCDSRSNCYNIIDFDRVRIKKDCIPILEKQLKSKRHSGVIQIGAMSDTYNPFEKKYEVTRDALKLIDKYGFGVAIATKSDLILRDINILKKINTHSPVIVKFSITCGNDNLSKIIEPNVCVSSKRFEAIKKLREAGIYTGILMMPLLSFINDTKDNIDKIINQAYKSRANFIYPMFGVTLRSNQRFYYYTKLRENFPNLVSKYQNLYSDKYVCNSPNFKSLQKYFEEKCSKLGITYKMDDIISEYKSRFESEQISFDL
ncbi:SPL family radical SAM protein [Intestinibacter bartlettii]